MVFVFRRVNGNVFRLISAYKTTENTNGSVTAGFFVARWTRIHFIQSSLMLRRLNAPTFSGHPTTHERCSGSARICFARTIIHTIGQWNRETRARILSKLAHRRCHHFDCALSHLCSEGIRLNYLARSDFSTFQTRGVSQRWIRVVSNRTQLLSYPASSLTCPRIRLRVIIAPYACLGLVLWGRVNATKAPRSTWNTTTLTALLMSGHAHVGPSKFCRLPFLLKNFLANAFAR